MERGRRLTEKEGGVMEALTQQKLSPKKIARRINRSPKAVRNAQKALRFGAPPRILGPARKVSPKLVNAVVLKERLGKNTARDLQEIYQIPV